MLLGTWACRDGVWVFFADGTFQWSESASGASDGTGRYEVNGSVLKFLAADSPIEITFYANRTSLLREAYLRADVSSGLIGRWTTYNSGGLSSWVRPATLFLELKSDGSCTLQADGSVTRGTWYQTATDQISYLLDDGSSAALHVVDNQALTAPENICSRRQ
jgi:hypothetical protein